MTLKYNSLDVYFHMTNHYKKLRSAKSVVDTSSPLGYCERLSRPPSRSEQRRQTDANSGKKLNKRKDKFNNSSKNIYDAEMTPHVYDTPKSVRSSSIPRPPTRRRLLDMPSTLQTYPQRAKSSGPFIKEKSNIPRLRLSRSNRSSKHNSPSNSYSPRFSNHNSNSPIRKKINCKSDLVDENERPTPAPRKIKRRKCNSLKKWIAEHEYMEFMLRITEDIIKNNLYSEDEILRVLESHLEANIDRLSMPKMLEQIRVLCHELNVSFDKVTIRNFNIKVEHLEPLETVQKNKICTCNAPPYDSTAHEFGDCECNTKRFLPFHCLIHGNKNEIEDLLKITEDFSPSQNIVETYYFKNDDANLKQAISSNNNENNASATLELTSNSLNYVPEVTERSECSDTTNKHQTPQSAQKHTTAACSPKRKRKCNCRKAKEAEIKCNSEFPKYINDNVNIQPQTNINVNTETSNAPAALIPDQILYIGCSYADSKNPAQIIAGPLDVVQHCTNIPENQLRTHSDNSVNDSLNFKKASEKSSHVTNALEVAEKPHFYNKEDCNPSPDEKFIMSYGATFMPKSISQNNSSGCFFENVCVVAPDVDNAQLILLKNLSKRQTILAREDDREISETNLGFVVELPQVTNSNTGTLKKNNVKKAGKSSEKKSSENKCSVENVSVGTMTNKNEINKHKLSQTKLNKNLSKTIFVVVPDDFNEEHVFVLNKTDLKNLHSDSRQQLTVLKFSDNVSTSSSMYSCMKDMNEIVSYESSVPNTNPLRKVPNSYNINNNAESPSTEEFFVSQIRDNIMVDDAHKYSAPSGPFNMHYSKIDDLQPPTNNYNNNDYDSKVLIKLNDYDLTPQRDINSDCANDTCDKKATPCSKKDKKSCDPVKDRLLLGNEYEIKNNNLTVPDYSIGIPDCVKQFYPNAATQTELYNSSREQFRSEPSIKALFLEPKRSFTYIPETQNQYVIGTTSQNSIILTTSQAAADENQSLFEKTEPVDQMENKLEETSTQVLDLIMDFETNPEDQGSNDKLYPQTRKSTDSLKLQTNETDSAAVTALETLLVSEIILDPVKTSNSTINFDEIESSLNEQLVDEEKKSAKNFENSSSSSQIQTTEPSKKLSSDNQSFYTDSELLRLLNNGGSIPGELNKYKSLKKDNMISDDLNKHDDNDQPKKQSTEESSLNSQLEFTKTLGKEVIKKVEYSPQTPAKNVTNKILETSDDDEDDGNYYKRQYLKKHSSQDDFRSSVSSHKINEADLNLYDENKSLENKISTFSAQKKVLIKEDALERQDMTPRSFTSPHQNSENIQIPHIEVDQSNDKINNTSTPSNTTADSTQTWCCGLKSKPKNKKEDNGKNLDKNYQNIPNISEIPDDQLYGVEIRRKTTAGYGAERKSLRFDYSMMSELSDVEGEHEIKAEPISSPVEPSPPPKAKSLEPLVIDIYKPIKSDSNISFPTDNSSLKGKNSVTQE